MLRLLEKTCLSKVTLYGKGLEKTISGLSHFVNTDLRQKWDKGLKVTTTFKHQD